MIISSTLNVDMETKLLSFLKKNMGGMTVVKNEKNKLISTLIVTR